MLCVALGVIAQNLDHSAIRNSATSTMVDHALQFFLQSLQAGHSGFDGLQLRSRDGIDLGAGLVGAVEQA